MNAQERREARNLATWHKEKAGWKKAAARKERLEKLGQRSVWLFLLARFWPFLLGLAIFITAAIATIWWIETQYPWMKYAGLVVVFLVLLVLLNVFFEEQDIRWRARIWTDECDRQRSSREGRS